MESVSHKSCYQLDMSQACCPHHKRQGNCPDKNDRQTETVGDCSNTLLRLFATRLIQLLVQARNGNNIGSSQCCSDDEQWFGMKIDELGEVSAYLRGTLSGYPKTNRSFCVEFLLHTADGERLPVESWTLEVDEKKRAPNMNVYPQLSRLLTSVASAARGTPLARHFLKKQSEDTFVVMYKVYQGLVASDLGDKPRKVRLATVPSGMGEITLTVRYRAQVVLPDKPVKRPEGRIISSTGTEHSGSSGSSSPQEGIGPLGYGREDDEDREPSIPRFGLPPMGYHIGDFIDSCKSAPKTLESFQGTSVSSLHTQLEMFKSLEGQFSSFVKSLDGGKQL